MATKPVDFGTFLKNVSFVKIMRKEGANLLMTSGHQASGLYTNFEKQHFSIRKFRYATLQLILRKNSLILCTHDNNRGESRISQVLCSLHSKETQMEKSSYHHYLKRLQPLIVHPGFGDLQKWILQVKYSLVAKEWVSDSKILKRRKKDP